MVFILILLSKHTESRLPALAEVREQVRREWLNARRSEATDRFYERFFSRYTVRIEPPEEKKVAQVQ